MIILLSPADRCYCPKTHCHHSHHCRYLLLSRLLPLPVSVGASHGVVPKSQSMPSNAPCEHRKTANGPAHHSAATSRDMSATETPSVPSLGTLTSKHRAWGSGRSRPVPTLARRLHRPKRSPRRGSLCGRPDASSLLRNDCNNASIHRPDGACASRRHCENGQL